MRYRTLLIGLLERLTASTATVSAVVCVSCRLSKAVRNIIVQSVCVAWKSGWLSLPRGEQEALLQRLADLLGLVGGAAGDASRPQHHELVGVQLCLQLVQQFSCDKATAVGMTVEFHRSCSESFQQYGLKEVFVLCVQKLIQMKPIVQGTWPVGIKC